MNNEKMNRKEKFLFKRIKKQLEKTGMKLQRGVINHKINMENLSDAKRERAKEGLQMIREGLCLDKVDEKKKKKKV